MTEFPTFLVLSLALDTALFPLDRYQARDLLVFLLGHGDIVEDTLDSVATRTELFRQCPDIEAFAKAHADEAAKIQSDSNIGGEIAEKGWDAFGDEIPLSPPNG